MTLLEAPVRWWKCPSCDVVDKTQKAEPHTQMHSCPAMGGISLPLVEVAGPDAPVRASHVAVEREDYCGDQFIPPVSAIRTERLDGSNDVTVLAPTALGGASAG